MTFIGVVCGLKSEAAEVASLREPLLRVGVSGANAQRAEEIADAFCDDGARAILSVGVSGGLDPALKPGDFILARAVVNSEGSPPSPAFQGGEDAGAALSIPPLKRGGYGGDQPRASTLILGTDEIIASPAEKARLFDETGAVAVDMESHGAARAATRHGVTFLAIRAIADPADRALPKAALGAVAPDGSTRVLLTLARALMSPAQFPALLKLGADSDAALKTLRRELPAAIAAVKRDVGL